MEEGSIEALAKTRDRLDEEKAALATELRRIQKELKTQVLLD